MKFKLLFFGSLVDITGMPKQDLSTDELSDVGLLNAYLQSYYPQLSKHQYQIAVNLKIAENNQKLKDGDEVAFLPPFAGG